MYMSLRTQFPGQSRIPTLKPKEPPQQQTQTPVTVAIITTLTVDIINPGEEARTAGAVDKVHVATCKMTWLGSTLRRGILPENHRPQRKFPRLVFGYHN